MTFEIIEIREGKLGYKIALLQRPEGAPERYVVAKDYNPEKRIWHMGGIYFTTLYDAVRCFERQTTLKDEDDNYEDDSETQEKRDSDMARLDEIHLLECFYVGQQEVVNMLLGEMECYKMEYYKMLVRLQERLKQIDARAEDKLAELESKKNELLGF